MKKYSIFVLAFVLTAAMLVGCGCTNQDMGTGDAPTVLPTNEEVMPTTRATTAPTTAPTTQATTAPTETRETIDRGNGPLEDTATETTSEAAGNARGILGGAGIGSGAGSAGGSMSRG